ncbi:MULTISPECIES: TMEM175 family protein [Oenococcus]
MVLELRVPASGQWQELFQTQFLDTISSYFFSFLFIASFWVSHHTILSRRFRLSIRPCFGSMS